MSNTPRPPPPSSPLGALRPTLAVTLRSTPVRNSPQAALAYARAKARERGAPGLGASLAPEVAEDEDEQDDLEDDEDDEEVAAAFFAAQAELALSLIHI